MTQINIQEAKEKILLVFNSGYNGGMGKRCHRTFILKTTSGYRIRLRSNGLLVFIRESGYINTTQEHHKEYGVCLKDLPKRLDLCFNTKKQGGDRIKPIGKITFFQELIEDSDVPGVL